MNDGALDAKAKEAAALIKATKAQVEALTGQKKALKEELASLKKDRANARKELDSAVKQRAEDKAKYEEAVGDQKKTLEDIDSAIAALEKGMGKSFLQTGAAAYLRKVVDNNEKALAQLDMADQELIHSFLQSGKDYIPASGEIVGILKQLKDNFDESLGGIVEEEEKAVAAFKKLKSSLEDLIATNSAAIESKTELSGQVAVKIVEGKSLITTTEKQMGDDMATLAQLKEACSGRGDEFATRQADAAAEVDAIGQAIGVLNNDDALELFKATDTKAMNQVSLLQIQGSPRAAALRALNKQDFSRQPALKLLAFSAKQALKAKAVDFSKIVKMIDDMVVLLKEEYKTDLATRDTCTEDLNTAASEKKEAEHAISGLTAEIEELAGSIKTQAGLIEKAESEVKAAKQAMSEASEQRKEENAEFITAVDLNNQAVKLIQLAKDKLNTFYNPDLVTPTDAPAEGEDTALVQDLPEGQPEMWEAGDRKNKGRKSGSVLALMDMLAGDLNKDTAALESDEKVAQSSYEKLSEDLAKQIAESTKAGTDAAASKAAAEESKLTAESTLSMKSEELASVKQTITDLHAKCDFLLENFEERAAKRENEIAGLQNAKAILKGAKLEP